MSDDARLDRLEALAKRIEDGALRYEQATRRLEEVTDRFEQIAHGLSLQLTDIGLRYQHIERQIKGRDNARRSTDKPSGLTR